jgi:hypothetical protein
VFAAGLLGSAVGGLLLYYVLRCTLLSLASVWRTRGYPDRRWWFVRRTFRRIAVTEAFLVATLAATVIFAR